MPLGILIFNIFKNIALFYAFSVPYCKIWRNRRNRRNRPSWRVLTIIKFDAGFELSLANTAESLLKLLMRNIFILFRFKRNIF